MADAEPSPDEQKRRDAEAKAAEDAEQAALPYTWSQTIKDLDVTVAIDAKYKGRDLDVKLSRTHLRVAIKGQDPVIDVRTPCTPPPWPC
jgi:hypothetical protein